MTNVDALVGAATCMPVTFASRPAELVAAPAITARTTQRSRDSAPCRLGLRGDRRWQILLHHLVLPAVILTLLGQFMLIRTLQLDRRMVKFVVVNYGR